MGEYLEKVTESISCLEDGILQLLREALAAGEEASSLLAAMSAGMTKVGESFEEGIYFLADLVLAGEEMKEGVKVLQPYLSPADTGASGSVVLCTVKGDIHDIGKNLVGTMLASAGFQVVDLGVDVPAERVVDAVTTNSAQAVGLSVLLTTMVSSIGQAVDALKEAGLREQVKIAIGGACVNEGLASRYGVDAVGRDAVEAVRIFREWISRPA